MTTLMGIPLGQYAVKKITTEPAPSAPAPARPAPPLDRVRAAIALRGCLETLKDPTVLTALQTLLLLVLALALLALVLIGGSL